MSERIYVGFDEDEALVLRNLFALLGEDADQRLIVWVPGERAVDVPEEIAEAYMKANAPKTSKATKAAKAAPAPAPEAPKE